MSRRLDRRTFLAALGAIGLAACSPEQRPSATPTPTRTPTPTPTPSPTPTPTKQTFADVLPPGNVNILVMGSDTRSLDIAQSNTDTICVVQITADRRRLNLVSIARDTYVTYPSGGMGKINGIYASYGPEAFADTVGGLLGIPIHFHLITCFAWFEEIVEILSFINVNNRLESNTFGVPFPVGMVKLIKDNCLFYVRERKSLPNGDLDRTERQRAALTGFAERLADLSRADDQGIIGVVRALWGKVQAGRGLTVDHALGMIQAVKGIGAGNVASVLLPIAGYSMAGGQSVDIINQRKLAELRVGLQAADLGPYVARFGLSNAPG